MPFYGEKGESWEGVVLNKSLFGEKWEFKVMTVSHWLSFCRRCNVHLVLLGPITHDSSQCRILLLGSVIDSSFCNWQWVSLCDSSPFWPPDSLLVKILFINFHSHFLQIPTILYPLISQQQFIRIWVAPHSCQYWIFSVFFILGI